MVSPTTDDVACTAGISKSALATAWGNSARLGICQENLKKGSEVTNHVPVKSGELSQIGNDTCWLVKIIWSIKEMQLTT